MSFLSHGARRLKDENVTYKTLCKSCVCSLVFVAKHVRTMQKIEMRFGKNNDSMLIVV